MRLVVVFLRLSSLVHHCCPVELYCCYDMGQLVFLVDGATADQAEGVVLRLRRLLPLGEVLTEVVVVCVLDEGLLRQGQLGNVR